MLASLEQQLLSQKAKKFALNPSYYDKGLSEPLNIGIDQSDNILTLSHCFQPGTVECLMIESLASLCLHKNLKYLWKIQYKELENFLRDENHIPALSIETIFFEAFSKMRQLFIMESLKQALAHHSELNYPQNDSNLVELNRWGQHFSRFLNGELILVEGAQFNIKLNPMSMSQTDINMVFENLHGARSNWPMFKVVAVS